MPDAPAPRPSRRPRPSAPTDDLHIPLRGRAPAIADQLTRSRREIPDATIWVDVDATALVEAKAAIRTRRPDAAASACWR